MLLLPLAASAQTLTKADIEKMVIGLYVIDVAIDVCDLDLTKEQEKRLDIADRKLNKTCDTLEEEVQKDNKAFHAKMTPIANEPCGSDGSFALNAGSRHALAMILPCTAVTLS